MVGVIAIGGRFLGLANLAYFFSDSVVTGFKTGAALYIASTQLPKLLGLEGTGGNFFERLFHVATVLPDASLPSFAIGHVAIALFLLLEWRLPGRPTTLIVVAAAIAATGLLRPGPLRHPLVGHLPQGLPAIGFAPVSMAEAQRPGADGVRLLPAGLQRGHFGGAQLCPETGLRDRPGAGTTALGASNVAAALVRGFPVSGGMSQTAVNDMNGATSPVPLVVTSIASR